MFLTTSGKDERSNSVELEQLGVGLGNLRNLHIHGLGAQADILAGGLWVGIGQEEFDDAGHVGLDQLAALLAVDGQSVAHLVKELSDLVDRHVGLEEILDLVEEQLTDRAGQVGCLGGGGRNAIVKGYHFHPLTTLLFLLLAAYHPWVASAQLKFFVGWDGVRLISDSRFRCGRTDDDGEILLVWGLRAIYRVR